MSRRIMLKLMGKIILTMLRYFLSYYNIRTALSDLFLFPQRDKEERWVNKNIVFIRR